MKKNVLIALFLLTGIALTFPQPGYSWGHRWCGPGVVVGAGAAVVGAGAALAGAVVGGQGMGIMDPRLPMVTPRLPMVTHGLSMVTPLRPMGILTTDRGTTLVTGTMVITAEGAIAGIGDKK